VTIANEEGVPPKADLNILKTIKLVPIFPIINELNRTIAVATAGEDYDFSYVMNRVTKNVDAVRENANNYAETLKSSESSHANADISVLIKAPVIKIYSDIFDKSAPVLEMDFG
jgi:hypothetical protein